MKTKGIMFTTPMVQALLREIDPKTQTRRVIKPQPDSPLYKLHGRTEYFYGRSDVRIQSEF